MWRPNASIVLLLEAFPFPSAKKRQCRLESQATPMHSWLRERSLYAVPSSLTWISGFRTLMNVSSSHTSPSRTMSSWIQSNSRKTLLIQYFVVLLAFLLTLDVMLKLPKPKMSKRNPIHSDMESLWLSNIVLVRMLNRFPHSLQWYLLIPLSEYPSLRINGDPQCLHCVTS